MSVRDMRIVYSSGISALKPCNSSFDSGVLRVAYTGKNRNNSFISKNTFERCLPSIYNCPVVCRYDRETDSIGAHDMELVESPDGDLRIVNVTHPVGVVPESARYWWEDIEDDSGIHEYLCVDVLLWKRQEAYTKIKENGITEESMEIAVNEGAMEDGVYVVKDFEFTAFCLLGSAEPCFESASLEVFSRDDFKRQFELMMKDFKESFSEAPTSSEAGIITTEIKKEGGDETLNLTIETPTGEVRVEEAEVMETPAEGTPAEETPTEEPAVEEKPNETPAEAEEGTAEETTENFALTGEQFREELITALSVEKIETCWGEMARYWYVDYSTDPAEVYCYDNEDWRLYGFTYSMNGDNVVIDFASKKRKKFSIVDFDEGEQTAVFAAAFAMMTEKYQTAVGQVDEMKAELEELRQFKTTVERETAETMRGQIFAQFGDLEGVEAFEALRENCEGLSAEELEEKCYAIRGRQGTPTKFSLESIRRKPIIKVPRTVPAAAPYGGIFDEYGIEPKKN